MRSRLSRRPRAPWIWRPRRRIAASSSRCSAAGRSSSVRSDRRCAASSRVGRVLLEAALALEQRLEQLGHRAQDVVGLRRDGLDELLVDAQLAQVRRRARRAPAPGRSIGSSSAPVSEAMPPGVNDRARCTRSWWVTRESASWSASGLRWRTRFWPKTESRSRSVSPWTSCDGRSWSSGRKRRRSTACVSSSAWLRSCSGGSPSRSSPRRSSVGALPLSWTCGWTWPRPAAARAAARRRGRRAGRRSRRPRMLLMSVVRSVSRTSGRSPSPTWRSDCERVEPLRRRHAARRGGGGAPMKSLTIRSTRPSVVRVLVVVPCPWA